MKCVYVDDFGTCSKAREMTEEELIKTNKEIENLGLEEYGTWIAISKLESFRCKHCPIKYCEGAW